MQVQPIKPNGAQGVTLPAQTPRVCHVTAVPVARPASPRRLAIRGLRRWWRWQVSVTGRSGKYSISGHDPADAFYRITKGIVAEFKGFPDGRRQIVAIRTVGDICGYPTRQGAVCLHRSSDHPGRGLRVRGRAIPRHH